jgi:hypothetical protein
MGIVIGMAFVLVTSVPPTIADQKKTKFSGTITATDIHNAGIHVDDIEDHHITLTEGEGTNVSTGEHKFMDGAAIGIFGTSDHIKGTGTGRGYAKMSLGDDAVYLQYEGSITTTLLSNGKPFSGFKGTFSFIKGNGPFVNIQGSGTYIGEYISRTIYVVEWEGEYIIKNQKPPI